MLPRPTRGGKCVGEFSRPAARSSEPYRVLPVVPEGVPADLRAYPRWVAWALVPLPGRKKPAKLPVSPRTGRAASSSNPSHWGTFDAAVDLYDSRRLAGIGFVFHPDGPHAGLDLDGVRDPATGDLDPLAVDLLRDLGTYTELSPSGTGVKAFALGRLDPDGPNRQPSVELYDRHRYFTITGHRLEQFPATVERREDQLRRVQDRLRPPAARPGPATGAGPTGGGFSGTDGELLTRAFRSKNGDQIRRYWHGDRCDKPSHSEALLGLAQLLVFWTGPDEDRLLGLLERSELWSAAEAERAKWGSRRPGGTWGSVYVARAALGTCRDFYGSGRAADAGRHLPPSDTPTCVSSGFQLAPPGCPVGAALRAVEAGARPTGVDRIDAPRVATRNGLRGLAGVCWHLAGKTPGGVFPLGVEVAARVFGVSNATASRWLGGLVERGVIRRVVWGSSYTQRASEWAWLGLPESDWTGRAAG